jgi:periplasmic divalent cation tolerance protein
MEPADREVACLITTPVDEARSIARAIIDARLAACVNIVPSIESVYWWDDAVQEGTEALLIVKTTRAAEPSLLELVRDVHPYDVFELVSLDIGSGNARYLEWIRASVVLRPPDG